MIKLQISPSRAGDKRVVLWEGINSMTNTGRFANISWLVRHLDQSDEPVTDPDIRQDSRVVTPISDSNKVTDQGILIVREMYATEEEYQTALHNGIPEYSFWMNAIETTPLPTVILQAAQILDQFGRFDRE